MPVTGKAVPVATEFDRPYWDGARERRLVLQRCVRCGLYSSQPRVICPRCHGDNFGWSQVSGGGTIHSYTIVYQTTAPGFGHELPYVVAHVQIAEEPSCFITANLLVPQSGYDNIRIGGQVQVVFEDRGDVTVPQFRLV